MPFRPKVTPAAEAPVDAEGELRLPSELGALAEQLQREAETLADCYPASTSDPAGTGKVSPVVRRPSTRRPARNRWTANPWVVTPILAVLVLCVAAARTTWTWHPADFRAVADPGSSAGRLETGSPVDTDTPAQARSRAPAAALDRHASTSAGEAPSPMTLPAAAFLQEVSLPELEGWLDLQEIEASETIRVSL